MTGRSNAVGTSNTNINRKIINNTGIELGFPEEAEPGEFMEGSTHKKLRNLSITTASGKTVPYNSIGVGVAGERTFFVMPNEDVTAEGNI